MTYQIRYNTAYKKSARNNDLQWYMGNPPDISTTWVSNLECFMDGQFEPLRGNLAELGIILNTASNDKHVPEIERQIGTVKERT